MISCRTSVVCGLVGVALLAACSEKRPEPPSMPVESAGQAMRRDNADIAKRLAEQKAALEKQAGEDRVVREKQARVDAIYAMGRRWDGAVAAAAGATRAKLDEPLAEMEKIKTEAAAIEVDACTGKARDLLVSSMVATIDAYRQFKGETGDPSEAVKAKNKEGANLLAESSAQISLCK